MSSPRRSALKAELLDASNSLGSTSRRVNSVGERLFNEASRLAARHRDLEMSAAREAEARLRAGSIHSPEARRLRGGSGGSAAAAISRSTDMLYRNAAELAKRKAALRAEAEAEARELSKPRMNEFSRFLADRMSNDVAKLAKIYNKHGSKAASSGASATAASTSGSPKAAPLPILLNSTRVEDFPYHPKIDPHSSARARAWASVPVDDRLYYKETAQREKRKQELLRRAREQEVQGCTFQPNVDSRPTSIPVDEENTSRARGTPAAAHPSTKNVGAVIFERSVSWAAERERRLKAARKELADAEVAPCTFAPAVAKVHGRRASISVPTVTGAIAPASSRINAYGRRASLPSFASPLVAAAPVVAMPPGFDSFLQRQELSRKNATELEERVRKGWTKSSNPNQLSLIQWTGNITQPKATSLSSAPASDNRPSPQSHRARARAARAVVIESASTRRGDFTQRQGFRRIEPVERGGYYSDSLKAAQPPGAADWAPAVSQAPFLSTLSVASVPVPASASAPAPPVAAALSVDIVAQALRARLGAAFDVPAPAPAGSLSTEIATKAANALYRVGQVAGMHSGSGVVKSSVDAAGVLTAATAMGQTARALPPPPPPSVAVNSASGLKETASVDDIRARLRALALMAGGGGAAPASEPKGLLAQPTAAMGNADSSRGAADHVFSRVDSMAAVAASNV